VIAIRDDRSWRALGIALLLWQLPAFCASSPDEAGVAILVLDQAHAAVPGVRVQVQNGQDVVASVLTDEQGRARIVSLKPARYELSASKDGYEPLRKSDLDFSTSTSIELTLAPALARHESIEVREKAAPVDQGSSPPEKLPVADVRHLPGRPANVSDALPLIPGVVRVPGGGLVLSAAGEHRSALIVNSADVTDPATGQFGLTVPIDSVETVNFYQTPFLAEFGRFSTGLVSVETRRGGEKWKWDLNDPFPDFRIRSWRLRGLRDATPRLNVEGPLIPGRLYFSEGLEYQVRKTEVYELPFPYNQKTQEGINSFAQLDWIASGTQLVTATVHVAPQRLGYVNLNWFNPESTTPDAATHNYTATLADHLTIGGGLLENTLSATRFDARVWGQGAQDLTITPQGDTGNYFARQNRNASRVGWTPVYTFRAFNWFGTHNFKAGSYVAGSTDNGLVSESPIDIRNSTNQLIERISFTGGQPFRRRDTEYALFAQDHWLASPRVAIDLGLRAESQELSESLRLAPRAGVSWNPFPNGGTVVRAGFGLFYDRVPLNVYSFDRYPNPLISQFDAAGRISAGPFQYLNGLGTVDLRSPFIFREIVAGNFSPRSATGSLQLEQPLSEHVRLRVGYMQSQSSGLVLLNATAPDPATNTGAYLLSGSGQSRYRQFEATARFRWTGQRQWFVSYVRSRARGDLNDFANYLGSFPAPILRPNQFANLPADLPNRILAWGRFQLPAGFRIAPLIEFRSGFPYAVTDVAQNYAGIPNANRFPDFLSVDSRFSKDLRVNPKYTVRLSVSGYNLTNHFNPEAFHNNAADPAFGLFFGQRGRRFTADFDVLF
jgi:hypothetical protein